MIVQVQLAQEVSITFISAEKFREKQRNSNSKFRENTTSKVLVPIFFVDKLQFFLYATNLFQKQIRM